MKQVLSFLLLIVSAQLVQAQNVGIGTTSPNINAALEIKSNNKGLLMPRLSTGARTSMTNVPKGLMVYDSTRSGFYYHDGSNWHPLSDPNYDSLLNNTINNPQVTVNMTPGQTVNSVSSSGIIYDDGGPSQSYSNSFAGTYVVNPLNNDSLIGYKIIIEQMNLAAGDSVLLAVSDDVANRVIVGGTTVGSYFMASGGLLYIQFVSNASVNAAGFKIRWSTVTTSAAVNETPPSYGWYFNAKKIAIRGGVSPNNAWVSDSLGRLSFSYGNSAKAKGLHSVAFGDRVSASGDYSFASNIASVASGLYSVAMGGGAQATAEGALAIGNGTKATGESSVALGWDNTASGDYSTALGGRNTATGLYSTAMGEFTVASGRDALSLGTETLASGGGSIAAGNLTTAAGSFATALGSGTSAPGSLAFAAGRYTTANSYCSFVLGGYNKIIPGSTTIWNTNDPLFIIGNGGSVTPSNALVMLKSGYTGIGVTDKPSTRLHVDGGEDASLSDGSGFVMIGDQNGGNLVFDNNEIIARDNGTNNTLYLQNTGGALVIGGTASKPGGGSWSVSSDARLKQNVKPYGDGLQQLLKINPVYFQYNNLSGYDTDKEYIGVVAQEIKEVAPYMVSTFKKDNTDYLKVDNSAMTYMLINAVKEQQEQIRTQETKLKTQQQQIDELKIALDALLKSKLPK
ncbi:MAG: tail fiber domain-containing protein [Bacteroidota bacterium]